MRRNDRTQALQMGLKGRAILEPMEARILLSAAIPSLGGLYSTTAALHETNPYNAVAVVGDQVLFGGGGYVGDTTVDWPPLDGVDIYNAHNGQWTHTRLSAPRRYLTAVTVGAKAYFAGGDSATYFPNGDPYFTSRPSDVIDVYDSTTGLWSTLTLPHAASEPQSIALGDLAIFSNDGSRNVDLYDTQTGVWKSVTLAGPSITPPLAVDGKAVFFDGTGLEVYDTVSGTLIRTTVPSLGLQNKLTSIGNKVVYESDGPSNTTVAVVFDVSTGTVDTHTVPLFHDESSVVVSGGKVFFAGGRTQYQEAVSAVDIYDSATNQWSSASLSQARLVGSAFAYGNLVVFSRGFSEFVDIPRSTSVTDIYNTTNGQWSATTLDAAIDGPAIPVDGQLLFGTYRQTTILTPSSIAEPTNPTPVADGGIADPMPTFTWDLADGADTYNVYLDQLKVATVNPSATHVQWQPSTALIAGQHDWQIVARHGNEFTAGPLWKFTVGAPGHIQPISPAEGENFDPSPTLYTWQPVEGATSYDLIIDGHTIPDLPFPHYIPPVPVAGGTHAWQVIARNALTTTAGPVRTFFTPVPDVSHTSKVLDHQGQAVYDGRFTFFAGGKTTIGDSNNSSDSDRVDIVDAVTSTWSRATLHEGRERMTTVVAGKWVIFAGGLSSSTESSQIDLYDASRNRWSAATLSVAQHGGDAVIKGSKVIISGGYTDFYDRIPARTVDTFDTVTGKWTSSLDRPENSVHGFVTANLGRYVLYTTPSTLSAYDTKRRRWIPSPIPLSGAPDLIAQKTAFFTGGAGSVLNRIVIFDGHTGQWMEKNVATPRESVSITALGDYAVFSGGVVSYAIDSDAADVFNLRTRKWSVHQLSAARGSIAIVKTGKALYFLGGTKDYSSNGVRAIDILDTATGNWSIDSLAAVRSGPTAALLGNQIIVTGRKSDADVGQDASENTADIYNPKTHTSHLLELAGLTRNYQISSWGRTAILSSLLDTSLTETVEIVTDASQGKRA